MYLLQQSDITKYTVKDITKEHAGLSLKLDKSSATIHCALQAMEYATKFN
jgi:hypothetical protein